MKPLSWVLLTQTPFNASPSYVFSLLTKVWPAIDEDTKVIFVDTLARGFPKFVHTATGLSVHDLRTEGEFEQAPLVAFAEFETLRFGFLPKNNRLVIVRGIP